MNFVLDEIQEKIIKSTEPRILVVSSAGTGKTTVLTERIKYLLNQGINPQDIVAITFTNNAAEEMKERLGDKARGAYIGTIHGYANRLLLINGIQTQEILENENFDKLFSLVKKNKCVVQPVKYLLVDEFQDVDDKQFEFLLYHLKPETYFLIGDDDQTIFTFRGSNVENFIKLYNDLNTKVYQMTNNYRCGSSIINFAKKFLNMLDNRIPKKIVARSAIEGTVKQIECVKTNIIANTIRSLNDYKDWFILTRTNSQVDHFISILNSVGIPTDTFKKADLTNEELKKKMNENSVKVLTAHSAKGLENKNVIVFGINPYNDDEARLAYVAATRAKENLFWCYGRKFL